MNSHCVFSSRSVYSNSISQFHYISKGCTFVLLPFVHLWSCFHCSIQALVLLWLMVNASELSLMKWICAIQTEPNSKSPEPGPCSSALHQSNLPLIELFWAPLHACVCVSVCYFKYSQMQSIFMSRLIMKMRPNYYKSPFSPLQSFRTWSQRSSSLAPPSSRRRCWCWTSWRSTTGTSSPLSHQSFQDTRSLSIFWKQQWTTGGISWIPFFLHFPSSFLLRQWSCEFFVFLNPSDGTKTWMLGNYSVPDSQSQDQHSLIHYSVPSGQSESLPNNIIICAITVLAWLKKNRSLLQTERKKNAFKMLGIKEAAAAFLILCCKIVTQWLELARSVGFSGGPLN